MGKLLRRTFLLGLVSIPAGLVVGWAAYRRPYPNPLEHELPEGSWTFNPYLKIGADNSVVVIVPRAEMGQGVTTTLAALVAEELDQPIDSLHVEHGPPAATYFNRALVEAGTPFAHLDESGIANAVRATMGVAAKFLALQVTGGSSSVVDAFDKMRAAGAAARAALVRAASDDMGVAEQSLVCERGAVVHAATGEHRAFSQLLEKARDLGDLGPIVPKSPERWSQLGRALPRVDVPDKVHGRATFGIDVEAPGLIYGTVRMNPHHGAGDPGAITAAGGMAGFDATEAEAMPGVLGVVDLGGGIGVLATDTWRCFQAAKAVAVEWKQPTPAPDTEALFAAIAHSLEHEAGGTYRDDGDASAALREASAVVEAEYRVPYLAHTCMEPMNATAQLGDSGCDLWLGTQAPTIVRDAVANHLALDRDQVRVHTTLLGGGFGRRGEIDFAIYAAELARHGDGRPVKVTWSREEDTTHDFYRPAAIGRFRGALDTGGTPAVLDAKIAAPSVTRNVLARMFPRIAPIGPDRLLVEGSFDQPYAIPHYRVAGVEVRDLPIPVGFWRSVGNSYNAFFHESFLDELAHAGNRDPLEMRMELMQPWPAAVAVLETLAERSGWSAPLAPPRGRGVAFTLSFGSYVGQVVEVTDTERGVRIDRVTAVMDCGRALDPGILEAQVESGVLYGLSAAVTQAVEFEEAAAQQTNFHDYPAIRMNQAPPIDVTILENAPKMGGAGEPATPPVAPALGNAIFAATGTRVRKLPFSTAIRFAT